MGFSDSAETAIIHTESSDNVVEEGRKNVRAEDEEIDNIRDTLDMT